MSAAERRMLHNAVRCGGTSEVKRLLADPQVAAHVNEQDEEGFTPLFVACMKLSSPEIARLLLKAGPRWMAAGRTKRLHCTLRRTTVLSTLFQPFSPLARM